MQTPYSLVCPSPRSSLCSQCRTLLLASSTEALIPAKSQDSVFTGYLLPVTSRILFKILLLVFDCLQGLAPAYLQNTITLRIPGRLGLRSNARSLEAKTVKSTRREKRRSRLLISSLATRDALSLPLLRSIGTFSRLQSAQQPTGATSRDC